MPFDGQRQIRRLHPVTVIAHTDERDAAPGRHYLDFARAGIERILNQLLNDACRALDDLARGDAVDGIGRELPDCQFILPRDAAVPASAAAQTLARELLPKLDGRLVERINAEQEAGEARLKHEMHEQCAKRPLVESPEIEGANGPASPRQPFRHTLGLCCNEIADRL